jgi:hypothetical protein
MPGKMAQLQLNQMPFQKPADFGIEEGAVSGFKCNG